MTAQKTMEAYYRKLAEGMGRGEEMQAMQLEMLCSEEHSKDWVAFVVSGDNMPIVLPEGKEPRVAQEPPQTEGGGGCATRPSGRGAPMGSMLIGLLGLVLRRRDR